MAHHILRSGAAVLGATIIAVGLVAPEAHATPTCTVISFNTERYGVCAEVAHSFTGPSSPTDLTASTGVRIIVTCNPDLPGDATECPGPLVDETIDVGRTGVEVGSLPNVTVGSLQVFVPGACVSPPDSCVGGFYQDVPYLIVDAGSQVWVSGTRLI
jgi:hypothetical protein